MRISDWSSDVCSSDLHRAPAAELFAASLNRRFVVVADLHRISRETMSDQQNQKVVFITGGGSGIGLATAEELIRNGYAAVLVDRNEKIGRASWRERVVQKV